MSTSLIIYLASIADGARVFLGCHIFAFGMTSFVALMLSDTTHCQESEKSRKKWAVVFVILGALSSVPLVLIPSGADIYKIAGVTDQQKATIDASGQILESKQ